MSLLRFSRAAGLMLAPLLVTAWTPAAAISPGQIETALRAESNSELEAFYRIGQHRPLWTAGDALRPEALQLVDILRKSGLDGFTEGAERAERLQRGIERAQAGRPHDLAQAEVLLSLAWIDYVQALRRPADVGITYIDPSLSPIAPTGRAILNAAAAAPSLSRHLDEVSALNPVYARLRQGYDEWKARWGDLPRVHIPEGPALASGSAGERVQLLRERLGLSSEGSFDAELASKLKAFKAAHGLEATPVADEAAIEALNQDMAVVERRLRLNLDRARALPAGDRGRFVLVDAASARLYLYENGEVRDSMKVIVGKPGEQTPMIAGLIRTTVLNPYWNVPPDLVQRRIAPSVLKEGAGYLKAKRYEILSDWSEEAKPVDPATVDWAAVAAGETELRVRQLPGAENSMGAMKFMFPNQFGVYLHDTPEKALFADANRTLSSGCVRVENAARLATWLFGKAPRPSTTAPEQAVALPEPVPVFINYFTAGWSGDRFALRQDPYGRDNRIQTASSAQLAAR
ncbi:MAG TPA: L,D-transpeptidase family protein [Allosphingosinicella sp.]|jgi:murein L,D-transpeptidase YcbB/YkuD|uniref:L,D-transpeptidase family protein n=1 Tax=Allosphingosinicella sp. TaxID=2823234 RepID=UPI002F2A0871